MVKFVLCWFGVLCTFIGVLNLIFYTTVSPIMEIEQSVVVVLIGCFLMYVGRDYLPAWLAYFFSGSDSGDD